MFGCLLFCVCVCVCLLFMFLYYYCVLFDFVVCWFLFVELCL